MKKKIIKLVCAVTSVACVFLFTASAGINYHGYNIIVGKFNGNAYTSIQKTDTSYAKPYLSNTFVGGGYKVDVREVAWSYSLNRAVLPGSWAKDIKTGFSGRIPASSATSLPNTYVRLYYSNRLATPVNVQITGKWKSN